MSKSVSVSQTQEEAFMTLPEAARFLAVAPSFLYEKSRPGCLDIKSYRIGKYRRFLKSDLLDWIKQQNQS